MSHSCSFLSASSAVKLTYLFGDALVCLPYSMERFSTSDDYPELSLKELIISTNFLHCTRTCRKLKEVDILISLIFPVMHVNLAGTIVRYLCWLWGIYRPTHQSQLFCLLTKSFVILFLKFLLNLSSDTASDQVCVNLQTFKQQTSYRSWSSLGEDIKIIFLSFF